MGKVKATSLILTKSTTECRLFCASISASSMEKQNTFQLHFGVKHLATTQDIFHELRMNAFFEEVKNVTRKSNQCPYVEITTGHVTLLS